MYQKRIGSFLLSMLCCCCGFAQTTGNTSIPHLRKQGSATQLIVAGEPYIVLGGELGNSTFTSVENMAPVWSNLQAMHVNTILAPVYWEIMEPKEGVFDFKLLDDYNAIGFSPFSIESKEHPENEDLGKVYRLLDQLRPMITAHQGRSKIKGILLDKEKQATTFTLGKYEFTVKHSHTLGWEGAAKNELWEPAGAIIIQTAENEFYIAGSGIVATFKNAPNPAMNVGILKNEEGWMEDGKWHIFRHLNGDQTHQGRHICIFRGDWGVQRLELYEYE